MTSQVTLESLPHKKVQMYFSPNFFGKIVRDLISLAVVLTLCFAYTFCSFFIVRQIAQENESGIKV